VRPDFCVSARGDVALRIWGKMKGMAVDLAGLKARYPGAETYRFGDSAALSDALLALVRAGKKRATCTAEAEIGVSEVLPEVGRCDVVLDFDNVPQLVTRTLELVRVRFCDMTEEMALMEGEDETLAGWRAGHERYYRRAGIFAPDMGLIWERFEVVEDLGGDS
jgi:uncharacterized protein YhfF